MAINNFKPTVWLKKIQTQLDTITSLKDHCDFQYEGSIRQAERLKIIGVARPTIKTYVPGTDIEIEKGNDTSQYLEIDQYKYFAFEVDDVDKAQSMPGLIEALSMEATKALSEQADIFVATVIDNALAAGYITATATDISAVTDGGISVIEAGLKKLYENNCLPSDNYWLELSPEWYTIMRPAITALATDNMSLIKQGVVGMYANCMITIENNLKAASSVTVGGQTVKENLLRSSKAVAFAGQLEKVEAFRPQGRFSDAVKGLYVYGAKVVRPEQIIVLGTY